MASTSDATLACTSCTSGSANYERHAASSLSEWETLAAPRPHTPESSANGENPQAVDQAYDAVWALYCGHPPTQSPSSSYPSSQTFDLQSHRSYGRLYKKLDTRPGLLTYFEEEVRKYWYSDTGLLTIFPPMALPVHEVFKQRPASAITGGLAQIGREHAALQPFCQKIVDGGHSHVRKESPSSRAPLFDKCPDGQLRYEGERYPPFVFEIGYSQDGRDLHETVAHFFEAFPGRISTAVAIDIDYAERTGRKAADHCHAARVSLWTSALDGDGITITCLLDAETFRDAAGHAMPGELAIPFGLFLPAGERARLPSTTDASVRLGFGSLCAMIDRAEQIQRTADRSVSPVPPPRLRRVRWADRNGTDTQEKRVAQGTRRQRRADSGASSPPSTRTRSRTRLLSQPRRSGRARPASTDTEGA